MNFDDTRRALRLGPCSYHSGLKMMELRLRANGQTLKKLWKERALKEFQTANKKTKEPLFYYDFCRNKRGGYAKKEQYSPNTLL